MTRQPSASSTACAEAAFQAADSRLVNAEHEKVVMDEIDEIIAEFLVESHEGLDRFEADLLTLEQTPDDHQVLASVFRTVHTIKGTCGFLGFDRLESLTHVAENLLGQLRDGEFPVSESITTALLATGDAIRGTLQRIEATGQEGDSDHSALTSELARLAASGGQPANVDEPVDAPRPDPVPAAEPAHDVAKEAHTAADVEAEEHDAPTDTAEPTETAEPTAPSDVTVDPVPAPPSSRSGVADATIRVDVRLLDGLMNLVGELVLARNELVQLTATAGTDLNAVAGASQRLNLITTELQSSVMKTRMQPIGHAWSTLPRVVRDLAKQIGKDVRVEMEGEDTELDKSIIEAIRDPLTHLVRNAVDHGIESADTRAAAGKNREGRLLLRAFHDGGQVNIEISDDGGGINTERVVQTAISRGVVEPDAAAQLSERQILDLIFAPGFSTAAEVTNVSGRGVGMDVVRTNIERIGGTVDLQSRVGEGTTVRVKIPLTLAIVPALIVSCADQAFAIPQVNVLELVRAGNSTHDIEHIHGAPVYRLRDRLLPLVDLRSELEFPAVDEAARTIVVLQADMHQFGLLVDGVADSVEIVVKPLGRHLKGVTVYAGATIMGDGSIGLILDVMGLGQRARVLAGATDELVAAVDGADGADGADTETLLVCEAGGSPMAIPLQLVDRLEKIRTEDIEHTGRKEVVQYRGEILPLLRLGDILPGARSVGAPSDELPVVIHRSPAGFVGVVVDRIVDVVEHAFTPDENSRPGVQGSTVVAGRVTEIVDLPAALRVSGLVPDAHV